ncbi:class III extradiol ring-cleavage dioxygenase family protein [Aeromicrobium terrae]|uniref:Uncharacterized protein n=1 Tax=Aeromicrobium terrae TaxID=2498846 RepID=A0A5C8NNC7_9ACTN|nr:hypothetical protein [Aeromicrobium terrae]TXL63259.1 hypothetical protein FHP06_03260 [Aeromicrobium terrae]
MIIAAAVCPHPPALVAEVAGAADELADVREQALAAVEALVGASPDRVVVLGAGDPGYTADESAGGTLAGHGVDVRAGGARLGLPLSLTVGAWLLDQVHWQDPRTYTTEVPDSHDRVALLVMADGSARRSLAAPGHLDERAEAFDAGIARALAEGDAAALADLDLDLAGELLASGAPTLVRLGEATKGTDVAARLRCDVAPFGVGYWVADWTIS